MTFQKIIIEHTIEGYTIDILYVPNDYVGEVSKRIYNTKNIHDLWIKLKEVLTYESISTN